MAEASKAPDPGGAAELRDGVVESPDEVRQLLRQALQRAAEQGGRELCWMAEDFSGWPLSDPGLLDALHRWALPHRRLHLLSADFEPLRRAQPRFVTWRQQHDHVITARKYEADKLERSQPQPIAALLAPGLLVLRVWSPGRASLSLQNGREEATTREWFDAIEQRSEDSFASSTLGL